MFSLLGLAVGLGAAATILHVSSTHLLLYGAKYSIGRPCTERLIASAIALRYQQYGVASLSIIAHGREGNGWIVAEHRKAVEWLLVFDGELMFRGHIFLSSDELLGEHVRAIPPLDMNRDTDLELPIVVPPFVDDSASTSTFVGIFDVAAGGNRLVWGGLVSTQLAAAQYGSRIIVYWTTHDNTQMYDLCIGMERSSAILGRRNEPATIIARVRLLADDVVKVEYGVGGVVMLASIEVTGDVAAGTELSIYDVVRAFRDAHDVSN